MNSFRTSVMIGGRELSFETGKYAKQSSGAVVIRQGDSMVLCTAVAAQTVRPGIDFLPLTVEYQDRAGAYGRIPGSFFKREGRMNEREILVSRLIDRPIRPLFPKHFRNDTQIIAVCMSLDPDNDTDVLSVCGSSAALYISDAPLKQPAAAVRISIVGKEFVVNPNRAQRADASLNVVVAGTADAVIMVEGGGRQVSETVMLEAIELGHAEIKNIVVAIEELRALAGVPRREVPPLPEVPEALQTRAQVEGRPLLLEALATTGKHARHDAVYAARDAMIKTFVADLDVTAAAAARADIIEVWESMARRELRRRILEEGQRIDGRATDEIRPIWCEVGIAPRCHGSAVFTRGETQVFANVALGTDDDAQRTDFAGDPEGRRSWMLTYNFPPYCTGEAYMMRGPKRREVGHGALAHRSIEPILPSQESFPYVIRSTVEVMESNGSSSMATVCGTTLALMDAGVPLVAPVAGIAMGLIKDGEQWAVLSDILGDEDHLGDMDFKVTGTTEGITAFQMDVKIDGVSREILARALSQAREGRLHILGEMDKVLSAPRSELSRYAPRITTIQIKTDRIRDIIGPGGKTIRSIQERTGTKIAVDDTGRVDIAATDDAAAQKAMSMIRELTQEAEIGKLYVGVVKRIVEFGAFVEIFPGTDGLVHISHLAKERVNKVTDVLNEGDEVLVRVIDIDKAGKIRLSRKDAIESSF